MRTVLELLIALNHRLYSYKYHLSVLVIWVALLISPYKWTHYWLLAGFVTWVGLMLHKFYTAGVKKEVATLKKIKSEQGALPFLVGFNISLLFGPIGTLLAVALSYFDKGEE